MLRTNKTYRSRPRGGFAYVAILLLLVIVFTMGMGFILRVSAETTATMTRGSTMQAHYLAESAVNHATWNLLNDPAFPADETKYYMHDLAGGRYGYKVRRHTDTTFATVAAIGGLGETIVQQSYVLYILPPPSSPDCTPPAGMIGWWKMDDGSGTTVLDSSGFGNDGSIVNMTANWVTGQVDGALEFDGNDGAVSGIGDCPAGNFTIACWAQDTGGNGWKVMYSAQQEIWLGVDSGANAAIWMDVGGNGRGVNTAASTWDQNTWHHVAGTWDGTDARIYIDGVEMPVSTYGAPRDPKARAGVIGAWSNDTDDENWFGLMDDVLLYDFALSASEISDLANCVSGGPASSSVQFEEFTETIENIASDTIELRTPPGTSAGDLLIAAVAVDSNETLSAPAGWTVIEVNDDADVSFGVWYKIAGGSEPSSYDFTWGSTEEAYGWMMRFTGHDPASPINASATDNGTSSTPDSPSITTSVDGALIVRLGAFDDDDVTIDDAGVLDHTTITMDGGPGGKIYWAEKKSEKIQRAYLGGSNLEDLVTGIDDVKAMRLDSTGGKIYWAENKSDKIQRSNLDGSSVEDLVSGIQDVKGMQLDTIGGKIYWAENKSDKIQRSNLDGSSVEDLVTGIQDVKALELDISGGKIYWAEKKSKKIQRSNLDGSTVEDLVTGIEDVKGMQIDPAGGKIYWAENKSDKIQRSNLNGSSVEDLVTGIQDVKALELDTSGGKIYWAENKSDKIQRSNLDGSSVEDLVSGIQDVKGMQLDTIGGKMYWAENKSDKIQRSNLDGSSVEDLVTGIQDVKAMELDLDTTGGTGTVSGGAAYTGQPLSGATGTSNFGLTGIEQFRTVTVAIAPDPS